MTVRKINPALNLIYLIWPIKIAMPLGAYSISRLYPHTRFAIRKITEVNHQDQIKKQVTIMKNLFIAILLLFSVSSKANNNDEGIAPVVLKSFHSSFKDAKEQRWTKVMDYYKVEFKLEGQDFTAYYGYEGEMIY